MRKRTAAALLAATAGSLAWPPARRWMASVLIETGMHLDHLGEPPGPTPEQAERMHRRFVDELADALVRRRERAGETKADERTGTNGHRPVI